MEKPPNGVAETEEAPAPAATVASPVAEAPLPPPACIGKRSGMALPNGAGIPAAEIRLSVDAAPLALRPSGLEVAAASSGCMRISGLLEGIGMRRGLLLGSSEVTGYCASRLLREK